MPNPLPRAIRERCVRFVEAGHSCHATARKFEVSPSFVIKLMRLQREAGSIDPRPRRAEPRGKLHPHRAFILHEVEKRGDITMPELRAVLFVAKGTDVAAATLSRFLIACGLSRKKNSSRIRTRQA
jgi:transposase